MSRSRREHPERSGLVLRIGFAATAAAAALLVSGCAPPPEPLPTSTGEPSPGITTGAPTPGASATPTAVPSSDIVLPARCEDIYSIPMLSALNEQNPPLNHPGVTMYPTQIVQALELIELGAPTLRCSWGGPSEYGLATNVTIIDQVQRNGLLAVLAEEGLICEARADGDLCRLSSEDEMAAFGETHFLRGNGWVATHWINFDPTGYTEDIIATLWG